MILDGTECPIQRPQNNEVQRYFYSGKSKKHSIKYEVGVKVQDSAILWVYGGEPGSVHDLTMARTGGIENQINLNEYIMADKGYIGENYFITPIRNPTTELEQSYNSIISS